MVAAVPLVGLDPLARLKEVPQNLVKKINVGILTCRVWILDPNKVLREDVYPRRADFPAYLMDTKTFPFIATPFWGMRKSMPSTVIVQSLIMLCMPNLLSKTICVCGGGGGGGVRTGMEKKVY